MQSSEIELSIALDLEERKKIEFFKDKNPPNIFSLLLHLNGKSSVKDRKRCPRTRKIITAYIEDA